MMSTTFWHPDGTPMSAQQFMELLFGKLPEFFKDEAELRALWSVPETRKKLLRGLAEKGFGGEQLAEMQKIIDAEKSDLFDVLAHVAYALPPLTREKRAASAKGTISTRFNNKQQVFLDFVLSHYVRVGVEELDQEKLTPLLRLKYHNSIADALVNLGRAEEIGQVFAGFQKYLYQQQSGASVIKCCYAATGMYMTAAAAVLRKSANARTSLSHQTTRRRDTKMSRRVSRRVASPACIAGVRVSRPNLSARCGRTKL